MAASAAAFYVARGRWPYDCSLVWGRAGSGLWLLSDRKTAPSAASDGQARALTPLNERSRDMAASAAAFNVSLGRWPYDCSLVWVCAGSGPWLLSDHKTAPSAASDGQSRALTLLNERIRDMAASAAVFYVARGR